MATKLVISIQTFSDVYGWDVGLDVLSQVFKNDHLRPDRIALNGEVTKKHGEDVTDIEQCAARWGEKTVLNAGSIKHESRASFHWKRSTGSCCYGSMSFPSTNLRGKRVPGYLHLESKFVIGVDWMDIFSRWCLSLAATAGMIHPAIDVERKFFKENEVTGRRASSISEEARIRFIDGMVYSEFASGDLNTTVSGLTDIGAATYLGKKYALDIDLDKLTENGYRGSRLGEGFILKVTEDLSEVGKDFQSFRTQRSRLKGLLPHGLFLSIA